jgi:hypothetical protein
MKKLLTFVIALSLLVPFGANAAIAVTATGFTTIAAEVGASASVSIASVNLPVGTTKLLFFPTGRATITGCTFNGVAGTLALAGPLQYTYNYQSAYYLDSPTTGSAVTMTCNFSGANILRGLTYIALSGTGTGIGNTVTPAAGTTDGSQITSNITTTAANSWIIESAYSNNDTVNYTRGSGQVPQVTVPGSSTWISTDTKVATTSGSNTVTIDPDMIINNDVLVFEVKEASAAIQYQVCGFCDF